MRGKKNFSTIPLLPSLPFVCRCHQHCHCCSSCIQCHCHCCCNHHRHRCHHTSGVTESQSGTPGILHFTFFSGMSHMRFEVTKCAKNKQFCCAQHCFCFYIAILLSVSERCQNQYFRFIMSRTYSNSDRFHRRHIQGLHNDL